MTYGDFSVGFCTDFEVQLGERQAEAVCVLSVLDNVPLPQASEVAFLMPAILVEAR